MGSLRATFAAIVADRAVLSSLLFAVILYSFFYPSAYRHEVVQHVPIAAVDLDHSASSRALLRRLSALRTVELREDFVSLAEARRAVERGAVHGFALIPAGFERDGLRDGATLALFADGADLSRSSAVLGAMSEAALAGAGPRLALVPRPLFNTREGYGSAVVPAVAILIIQQTLLVGVCLLIATRIEKRGRPVLAPAAVLGMLAAFCIIGLGNLLYFTGFVFWLQDYPRGGNFAGLLVAGALFAVSVSALALFAGSFFRVREHALLLILPFSLPLFFLGNISWPVEATPRPLVWLAALFPSTPAMNAMVKLNQMSARLDEVGPELANLALLALAYTVLAAWRFREVPTSS